jgi:hypothetical protein
MTYIYILKGSSKLVFLFHPATSLHFWCIQFKTFGLGKTARTRTFSVSARKTVSRRLPDWVRPTVWRGAFRASRREALAPGTPRRVGEYV